jgi:hypothetical protein
VAIAAIAWSTYVIAAASDAGLTVPALLILVWGALAVLGLWGVWAFVHWRRTTQGRLSRPWHWAYIWGYPVVVLGLVAVTWFGGTFWVRFLLSKPALEHLVEDRTTLDGLVRDYEAAIAARRLGTNARVGLFWVREAEVLPSGIVRLITTDCMFDHCGVVYSPNAEPPRIGEDQYSRLVGGWWRWWRSW